MKGVFDLTYSIGHAPVVLQKFSASLASVFVKFSSMVHH